MTFTRPWTVFCTAVAAAAPVGLLVAQATRTPLPTPEQYAASTEWPTYGHDAGGMRYSPLTTITPANVSQLVVAWSYHLKPEGDAGPAGRGAAGAPGEASAAGGGETRAKPGGATGGTGGTAKAGGVAGSDDSSSGTP